MRNIFYYAGYYRQNLVHILKVIFVIIAVFVIIYAIIHLSGISIEIKEGDNLLLLIR